MTNLTRRITQPLTQKLSAGVGTLDKIGGTYTPVNSEATTLIAAMTVQPNNARKQLIDNCIGSLKSAGVWSKMDFLHILAAHDAQAARLNWKNPGGTACTANGTITFTADRGYQGDGVNGYLDTGLLVNGLATYRQDTAHIGLWCVSEVANSNALMATSTASYISYSPRTAAGNLTGVRLNNGTQATVSNSVAKGHHCATRSVAATFDIYKNGASLGTASQTSTALTAVTLAYSRFNTSTYDPRQIAAGHGGLNLSATEITNLYNALNTYMTAVGAAP